MHGRRTGFDVREVDPQEVERLSERLDGIVGPEYLRAPGAHHFMAFEGEQPVAGAVLYAFGELGYLGMALTAEPFRRRGPECVNRPADQEGSGGRMQNRRLGNVVDREAFNLRKAGFETAYENEVYGLFADDEPRATDRHAT
jgi:hypothetical protein